jgi:hypothetical protein
MGTEPMMRLDRLLNPDCALERKAMSTPSAAKTMPIYSDRRFSPASVARLPSSVRAYGFWKNRLTARTSAKFTRARLTVRRPRFRHRNWSNQLVFDNCLAQASETPLSAFSPPGMIAQF